MWLEQCNIDKNTETYKSLEVSFPYPTAYPISYWPRLFHKQAKVALDSSYPIW